MELKGIFDIELGIDVKTNNSIVLTEQARQMHQLIFGPSNSSTYSVLNQVKQDERYFLWRESRDHSFA